MFEHKSLMYKHIAVSDKELEKVNKIKNISLTFSVLPVPHSIDNSPKTILIQYHFHAVIDILWQTFGNEVVENIIFSLCPYENLFKQGCSES